MWLTESHRDKHFLYSIPIGFVFTILCVFGLAVGMEYKDSVYMAYGWDWLDIAAGMLGGLIGQILQILVILLFI